MAEPELALDGLEVGFLETDVQIARSDLTFLIIPMAEQRAVRERARVGSDLELHCEYNSDLFDAGTIDGIVRRYLAILGQMVDGRQRRIEDLDVMLAEERRVVGDAWARAERAPLPDAPVHALIAAQAARTPGAIALEHDGRTVPYAELDRRARRLARRLRGRGVGPDAMVPVMVERSIEMVVAVLGVLTAGAAYVPIDPREPAVRRNVILADVGARLAIVGAGGAGIDRSGLALELIELSPGGDGAAGAADAADAADAGDPDREPPPVRGSLDQLAYIIYTSGSTGVPKGVMVTHRALLNHTLVSNRTYRLAADDRMLQFASLAFDASKLEIFPILTVGGTLVLRTDEAAATPERLLACCARWAITKLWIPTAFWHELVHAIDRDHLALPPALRLLIIGGELAQADRYARWWDTVGRRFPLCRPEPLRLLWTDAGLTGVEVRPFEVPTVFAGFDDYWRPFLGGQGAAPAYLATLDGGTTRVVPIAGAPTKTFDVERMAAAAAVLGRSVGEVRDAIRDLVRGRLPSLVDGSIPLTARVWAVRGTAGA